MSPGIHRPSLPLLNFDISLLGTASGTADYQQMEPHKAKGFSEILHVFHGATQHWGPAAIALTVAL
jgi:hypothetical protein